MRKTEILIVLMCVGILLGYTYGLDIPQALEVPLR